MKKRTSKTVLKQLGYLLILEYAIIALPSTVSLVYREWYSAAGFFISPGITFLLGTFLYRVYYLADDPLHNQTIPVAAFGLLVQVFHNLRKMAIRERF